MSETVRRYASPRVRIGVSACLLGQEVRFDGGHKRNGFLTGPLADIVDFVPVCPEVGIGMGIPRPPIRLVGDAERPRATGRDVATLDVTEKLLSFARRRISSHGDISGYILKKHSPSCGMERVKVYGARGGEATQKGVGIFARVLKEAIPLLPVEDEGRLADPVLRESFLTRIFVYRRWQRLTAEGIVAADLIEFHADHKYLVMARSPAAYERMGRILSNLAEADMDTATLRYATELMTALADQRA